MDECCLTIHRHNLCGFKWRFHIHGMRYANLNVTTNGKHVDAQAWFHMCNCVCDLQMRQNGSLHVVIGPNWTFEFRILWINHLIWVSRQAFTRKIGQKVRGELETHGYRNVAYANTMLHMHSDLHSTYNESRLYSSLKPIFTSWAGLNNI